ncbi:MAG TPA: SRPBCC family protein, partial [Acidobacteriaceae bacterium]|nr:SRPBCC family protein [Acidobacteriaceae bacterium]
AHPQVTSIKLDFLTPFESHNVSNFILQPEGTGTHVTWSMDGPNTYAGKLMSVFSSMDKIIGKDFEQGLANLKSAAERAG